MGRMTQLILVAVCAAACGGSAAGDAATQPQGSGEPSAWNAINLPQTDVVRLQCRGGPGYDFRNLGVRATPQGDTRVAVAMVFAPADGAAGSQNEHLQPGTCAPESRPLKADEPHELHFVTAAFAQLAPGPIDIRTKAAEYRPDVRSIADYLKDPARYWTFHAADTHRGYFDVTVHEHWEDRSGPPRQPLPDRLDELPPARWLVSVEVSGGLAASRRRVSINGDGRLQESGNGWFGGVQCAASVPNVVPIEAAMARARPETWPKAYPLKGNGCCDQLQYTLRVDREDSRGGRTSHATSWMDENASVVPEPVSALFKLVYEARHACVF